MTEFRRRGSKRERERERHIAEFRLREFQRERERVY
jgi:hypothetical protein